MKNIAMIQKHQTQQLGINLGFTYIFNIHRYDRHVQAFEKLHNKLLEIIEENGSDFDVEFDYVESEALLNKIRSFSLYRPRPAIKVTLSARFTEENSYNRFREEIDLFLKWINENQKAKVNLENMLIQLLKNPFFFLVIVVIVIAWLMQL